MKLLKKALSLISVFLLLFYQAAFPLVILAQEATSSASEEKVLEPTPEPTSSPIPTPTPDPEQTIEQSLWTENDGAYTTQTLQLGVTYKFPPNEKVSLTFTKLPESSGTLTIKEHEVPETVENAGSKDYEITSSMPNGSFSFDLTLPTNDPNKEVLKSQDGQNYGPVSNETQTTGDTITIKNIDHLTHFIVADESADYNHVVINEFLPDGSNEWVEMYNPTNQEQNITGWSIEDNDPDSGSPFTFPEGSTIPAKGFLLVDADSGFNVTLNDTGDTVNFISGEGTTLDSREYTSNPGSSSIGRSADGGPDWTTFSTPTPEVSNGTTLDTLYVDDDWSSPENDGIHTWGFDAFNSIYDAVQHAPANATINVEPGSYQLDQTLTIDKSLIIQGPGTDDPDNLATINALGNNIFDITANNVTISGFDLNDAECGNCATIIRLSGADNATIENNIIRDGYTGIEIYGYSDPNNPAQNNVISNNQINNNEYGIYLSGDVSGTSISNNSITQSSDGYGAIYSDSGDLTFTTLDITNNSQISDSNGYGIYLDSLSGTLTVSGNNISNNYYEGIYLYIGDATVNITNNTIDSNGTNEGYSGISINQVVSGNVTIQNNSAISDNGQYGLYIGGGGEGSPDVLVDGNTIENNISSGIYLDNSITNTLITNNTIQGNGNGEGDLIFTGIVVNNAEGNEAHQNKISGNTVGVQNNDGTNNFDATENFWGSILGPLHEILNPNSGGDSVSDNVSFIPWYLTDALTGLDSTDPIITFNMPLSGITLPPSAPVIASTNEAATCIYNLDGEGSSAMDTTGATSHIKDLSGLEPGSHSIQLTCTDSSGNSSTSSTINWTVVDFNNIESDLIFDSATEGQAELPDGITTLTLSNIANFDVSAGLNSAFGDNITIGGVTFDLSDFTSGDIEDYDFSVPQNIGGIIFEIEKAVALQSGTNGQPILLTNSDLSNIDVFLPDGVSVLAPDGWDGTIQPPKIGSISGIAPSGFSIGSTVIEVGSSDMVLLFDNPVEVILEGVTGPVGYKSAGSTTWTQITNTCGGTYTSPTNPTFPGECYISNGTDTKIVTYHFTSFASLNTASTTTSSSTSSSSSGGGGGGTPSAPTCGDSYAGGAPTLLSATSSGPNQVALTWSKALDPVTHYVVSYGLIPGNPLYGNPDVGGRDTTSYTVNNLSGGFTYYFRVRAGNGCNGGPYSNEIAVTTTGGVVSGPATGFAPGVLGITSETGNVGVGQEGQVQGEVTESVQASPTPQAQIAPSPFNAKVVAVIVVILLLGFGVFKLIVK